MFLKGLLTYRTIQFSMSSGCCHPKIHFLARPAPARVDWPRLRLASPIQLITPEPTVPSGGQKIRGPISFTNSASQTSVKFAVSLSRLPGPSTTLLIYFSVDVATSNRSNFTKLEAAVNRLFFFSADLFYPGTASQSNSQRTFRHNTKNQNWRKGFPRKVIRKFFTGMLFAMKAGQ